VSKEIIVIDMRAYRQMTGLCVTNAEQCEAIFSTKSHPSQSHFKGKSTDSSWVKTIKA
jgi:hypothetical protein